MAIYYLYFKGKPEMIEFAYNSFLFRPLPKLLSLSRYLSNYIIKPSTHHWNYKKKLKMIEFAYNTSFLQSSHKLLSLLGVLLNYIVKIIKLPYNIEISNHRFTIYHPYYKKKLHGNQTQTFICNINYLYFLYGLSNLLIVFFFTYNSITYIAKSSLVTKKRKPLRTLLYLLSHFF